MHIDDYMDTTYFTVDYPRDKALAYLGLGLTGEAGEVADKLKKWIRDEEADWESVVDELGDVLWYVAQIAGYLGYDLSEVALRNIKKLEDRKARGVLGGSGDNR